MGDGCSRAPHPARPTKRERETLPGAFSSPASPPPFIVLGDSSSYSAARGRQEKKEDEAAAVPPAGSLWPLRCLPPKGGAVRTNEPNRARLLLAATLPPPSRLRLWRLCGGQRFFPSLRRSPQPPPVPRDQAAPISTRPPTVYLSAFWGGGSLPPRGQPHRRRKCS